MSFKNILLIFIFCLGFIFSLSLIYLNGSKVNIDLLFFTLTDINLGVAILWTFLIGALVTFVIEFILFFSKKKVNSEE